MGLVFFEEFKIKYKYLYGVFLDMETLKNREKAIFSVLHNNLGAG